MIYFAFVAAMAFVAHACYVRGWEDGKHADDGAEREGQD